MPYKKYKLTEAERALIKDAMGRGVFNQPGSYESFLNRIRHDPVSTGRVDRALGATSWRDRASYETRAISHAFSNPEIIRDATAEHFEQKGIVGGLADIAWQSVTSPIRIIGNTVSGVPSDTPIQDIFDIASLGTILLPAVGLASRGLMGAGKVALKGTGKAALGAARKAGLNAATSAQAAGKTTKEAIEIGLLEARKAFSEIAPKQATGLLRSGEVLQDFIRNPNIRYPVRGAEVGSVVAAGEEAGLELIGEGLLDVSTSVLGAGGKRLRDLLIEDVAAAGQGQQPTPDVPITQQLPPPVTDVTPEVPVDTPPVDTPPVEDTQEQQPVEPGPPRILADLHQDATGKTVAPSAKGSKLTVGSTRKYSYGDPAVPDSLGVMTVRNAPGIDGKVNNKNWQVWFDDGMIEDYPESSPIEFGPDDGIGSYEQARDTAFDIATGKVEQAKTEEKSIDEEHAKSREQRAEKRQEKREQRAEKRQPPEPEIPDDEIDIEGMSENIANWIVDEAVTDTEIPLQVEDILTQNVYEGLMSEDQVREVYPDILARVQELIPEIQQENAIRQEEIEKAHAQVTEAMSNVKYNKTTVTVGENEVDGYTLDGTGIDFAQIALVRPPGSKSGWTAVEAQTGLNLINGASFSNRSDTAEVALSAVLDMGEAEFTRLVNQHLGIPADETPAEEPAPEPTTPPAEETETEVETQPEEPTDAETEETETEETPEETPPLDTSELPEFKRLKLEIVEYLQSGGTITAEQLFEAATRAYEGDAYNQQQVYDVLETAVNSYLFSEGLMDVNVDPEQAIENIEAIKAVEDRIPRQADRTTERIENQQYSTPYHYAYLVNWLVNYATEQDIVLEPSAGTGNLAWHAKAMGLEVHVNDTGKFRYRLLQDEFDNATNVDASQIHTRLSNVNPTVVVMNPPFSESAGKQKSQQLGVRMLESALKALQPGGRLVAIVGGGRDFTPEMQSGEQPGGGPNFEAQGYRKFWSRISGDYHIRANAHVSGEIYKAMGTTFNTRLIVIDKPMDGDTVHRLRNDEGVLNPEFDAKHKQHVDSIEELVPLLEGVRDARTYSTEQPSSEPTSEEPVDETPAEEPVQAEEPESDTEQEQRAGQAEPGDVPTDTPGVVSDVPTEPSGQPDERVESADEDTGPEGTDTETGMDVAPQPGEEAGQPDGERIPDDTEPGDGSVGSDRPSEDAAVRRETGSGGDDVSTPSSDAPGTDIASTWVESKESHIVKGRDVKLQETVSLSAIDSPSTDVEVNIPEPAKSLYSDAQMKAIKLAIRAHNRHIEPEILGDTPPRQGFYDGDDTGVGKTWIGSGILVHNWQEGRKKHVWLTASKNLVNDFKEAYPVAGGSSKHLLDMPTAQGSVKGDGILVGTYSTLAGQNMDTNRIDQILTWLVGSKPPASLLNPQTDQELLHFGDLPKTFALAFTESNTGEEFPEVVTKLIDDFKRDYGSSVGVHNINESWNERYDSIVRLSDQIRATEGGVSPAEWTAKANAFDGVIVFDESHKMKYSEASGARKATATGIRGRQLQRLLPNARIVYMSATGTTAIDNMAYMERLGIWGRDKPFADSGDFIGEMEKGGLASQEVVVRDLKAQGLFISRSLDFSDVDVRSIVHELSPEQEQVYNEMANAWQQIRLSLFGYMGNIAESADADDASGDSVGSISRDVWGDYYSKQQRFFEAMLGALKMQSVLPDIMANIDEGKKVTLQIVNTYESNQDRQINRAERRGTDINDVEFTAREILEDYLDADEGIFPTKMYEAVYDPNIEETVMRVMTDDNGNPIRDPEMEAKRQELEALVFRSFLPQSPLDQFVQAFKDRGLEIAEVTKRGKRFYRDESGERVEEKLSHKQQRADIKAFNNNELLGLVFSKAGGTGANYPATDENHPIVQYVIQVGWQADDFKQGLGRSKRADEVAPPEIVMTSTNLVGERRFLSTAAGRAAELGATTRSQAKEGTGLDLFDFDTKYIDSDFGRAALYDFMYAMMANGYTFRVPGEKNENGDPLVIGWDGTDDGQVTSFHTVTGIDIEPDQGNRPDRSDMIAVKQFMNRVLGAPSIAIQNALYYEFFNRLSTKLEQAKAEGLLDTGVETLKLESAKVVEDRVIYTDPESGASTYATDIEVEVPTDRMTWAEVERTLTRFNEFNPVGSSFYITPDGNIYLDKVSGTSNEDGEVVTNIRRMSPSGSVRYMRESTAYPEGEGERHSLMEAAYPEGGEYAVAGEEVDQESLSALLDSMKTLWEGEYESYPALETDYLRVVHGLMLDVWNKINPPIGIDTIRTHRQEEMVRREMAKRKLVRIHLDDGKEIIGRAFDEVDDFVEMLERFGYATEDVEVYSSRTAANTARIRDMLSQEGWTIHTTTGLQLKMRTSQGRQYISVEGDASIINRLTQDNIVEGFRPSGGRFVYELKSGNMGTFFATHTPNEAVKGRNRVEIDFQAPTNEGVDTPSEPGNNEPDQSDNRAGDQGSPAEDQGSEEDSTPGESETIPEIPEQTQPERSGRSERVQSGIQRVKELRSVDLISVSRALDKVSTENLQKRGGLLLSTDERIEIEEAIKAEDDAFVENLMADVDNKQQQLIAEQLPESENKTDLVVAVDEAVNDEKRDNWTGQLFKMRGVRNAIEAVTDDPEVTISILEALTAEEGGSEWLEQVSEEIRETPVEETPAEETPAEETPKTREEQAEEDRLERSDKIQKQYDEMDAKAERRAERRKAKEEETPAEETPDEFEEAGLQTDKYEFEKIKFIPALNTGEQIEIDAYRIKNSGISYADLVVHRRVENGAAVGGWLVAEVNTGMAINLTPSMESNEAIDKVVKQLDRVGEAAFTNYVDNNRRPTAEETEILTSVRDIENWTREGKSRTFRFNEGGGGIIHDNNMAVTFQDIPHLKQSFEIAISGGKNHTQRFQKAIDKITVANIDSEIVSDENIDTDTPEPESTPDSRDTTPTEEAMDAIEKTVEETVGDSAKVERSGDSTFQQITVTPERDTTPVEETPEETPEGDHTYYGATFTELENDMLQIEGDNIPQSFWSYWQSGGRGSNSAHKKAMKAAGWRYSWEGQGKGNRIYSFTIRKESFEKWKTENPDDGSEPQEYKPPAPVEVDRPSEERVKEAVLSAIESGNVQEGNNRIILEVDGHDMKVYLRTMWTSSVDFSNTGAGMTKPVYETKIHFVSPVEDKLREPRVINYDMVIPQEVIDKYNAIFEAEVLSEVRNIDNWTRQGRKNSFEYKDGGTITIKKDQGRYEAHITFVAGSGALKEFGVIGRDLEGRLKYVLNEMNPNQFTHHTVEKIKDTLKAETGEAEAETPGPNQPEYYEPGEYNKMMELAKEGIDYDPIVKAEYRDKPESPTEPGSNTLGSHLETLGIDSVDWEINDVEGQRRLLEEAYEKVQGELSEEQTQAHIKLTEHLNALEGVPPVGGGSPIVRTPETILDVPKAEDIDTDEKAKIRHNRIIAFAANFTSAFPEIRKKMDGASPKVKRKLEAIHREISSGIRNLEKMGANGIALLDASEYMLDMVERWTANDLSDFIPQLDKVRDLAKKRKVKDVETHKTFIDLSKPVWNYVEYNTPIENDPELLEIAKEFKDTWRKLVKGHTMIALILQKEVEALDGNERMVVESAKGGVRDWQPLFAGYSEWDKSDWTFQRDIDKKRVHISDVIDETDSLYMPHIYAYSHFENIIETVKDGMIAKLDAALKRKSNKLPYFSYSKQGKIWKFEPTDYTFNSKQEAVDYAKQYWSDQYAIADRMVNGNKDGDITGRYGNLEAERETTDKHYSRNLGLLTEHIQMVWQRFGEIAVFGQHDPLVGRNPRAAKYIARISETPLNARETAMKTVSDTLMNSDSGMFDRLDKFEMGDKAAYDIIDTWNTPNIDKMIEDNPEAFTDEVLSTLERIGFAEKTQDGYTLRGETDGAKRTTFVKHLVPYWQTRHLRKETARKIIRGIGVGAPSDPLSKWSAEVWNGLSNVSTVFSLGLGSSIQNIMEFPLLTTMAGTKATTHAVSQMATDADMREMGGRLVSIFNLATSYLADGDLQSAYLYYSLFTPTERASRILGVLAGWKAGYDAIDNYVKSPTKNNRKRLEELNISTVAIDNYRQAVAIGQAPALEALDKEARQRTMEGNITISGLKRPDAPPASNEHVNWVGDELGRAARFISMSVFKPYNALSLPAFMTTNHPMIRVFLKFKSWHFQMHRYMWKQFRDAASEAQEGNWGPAWRLGQGLFWLTGSTAVMVALFGALSGYDRDDPLIYEAFVSSQTLGMLSIFMEIGMYADGNPFAAQKMLNSLFGSPTAGIAARMGQNLVTGDVGAAGRDIFFQAPGIRELRRFGGFAFRGDEE